MTIRPPPASSIRQRWRVLDDARGAVPVSFSAAGKTSVMLHLSRELPATATGGRYFYLEKIAHLEPSRSYCWFEVRTNGCAAMGKSAGPSDRSVPLNSGQLERVEWSEPGDERTSDYLQRLNVWNHWNVWNVWHHVFLTSSTEQSA